MILTLIRHGQTDLGSQGKYCGFLDVPLNDVGKNQSEKLAERFEGTAIDSVYSSDLKRAHQTAQIAFKDKSTVKRPCFREMGLGILEGLSYQEAMGQYPDVYTAWVNDPQSVVLPQGEHFKDFSARVLQGLEELLVQNEGKSIALVSHGGPIRLILSKALDYSFKDFWSLSQENAAVNIIEYHSSQKPKVITVNDTEHLKCHCEEPKATRQSF